MDTGETTENGHDELARVVAAARDGDQDARAELVQRFQPLVASIGLRCGVAHQDLPDLSQEVWLSMFTHLHRLRHERAFVSWVSTITRNACVAARRSTERTTPTEYVEELADPAVEVAFEVDAGLQRDECVRVVRSGLAQLAPRHRDLLLMVAADPPVPYRLISVRLGMPVGSIGPTRARLLRRLSALTEVSALVGADSSAIAS